MFMMKQMSARRLSRAVRHMVQHQHIEGGQVLESGRRHAVHHPALEGVAGNDQAELELAELGTLRRHEVG
jgi:hypothetical protein